MHFIIFNILYRMHKNISLLERKLRNYYIYSCSEIINVNTIIYVSDGGAPEEDLEGGEEACTFPFVL